MTSSAPHVSRLAPDGPTVLPTSGADAAAGRPVTLQRTVGGDPEALGRLLADVEALRADTTAVIVTDADAEVVRFLAVLAVLEQRAVMPDYDLNDPSLKWHAAKGVKAVPNAPTRVDLPPAGPDTSKGGAA